MHAIFYSRRFSKLSRFYFHVFDKDLRYLLNLRGNIISLKQIQRGFYEARVSIFAIP